MPEMTLAQLAEHVNGTLVGNGDTVVRGCASLEAAGPDQVSFLANDKYTQKVAGSDAAAVIVSTHYDGPGERLIRCDDPYFAFRGAMVALVGFRQPEFDGIDERANIHPSALLGTDVKVAAFVTIARGVHIGDGCVLYPGVYVGPGCRVGAGCTLHPNVTLYDGTVLGERVTIHAGSSIGHDGFGYATHQGAHHKIPQGGRVMIESDVEVGACCAIDRAALGETAIGQGTKFSNHVTIGHGTTLGKHCLVVAQTGIAGSVKVGNYCVFAGQAGVAGHISIGDGAQIGAQAGVTNSISAGEKVWGTPAIPLTQSKRALVNLPHLPKMRKEIGRLQEQIAALEKQMADLQDQTGEQR